MKKILSILVMATITLLFIAGCEADVSKVSDKDMQRIADKVIVCNDPYIRFGSSCCLDVNSNNVCDNDETIIEKNLVKNVNVENNEVIITSMEKERGIVKEEYTAIGNATINFILPENYMGRYQLPITGNIELNPYLDNVKIKIYMKKDEMWSDEKQIALIDIGKVTKYQKLNTEISLSKNTITYTIGNIKDSIQNPLDSFVDYKIGMEITSNNGGWGWVQGRLKFDNEDALTSSTNSIQATTSQNLPELNSIYDVLDSIKNKGNSHNFIFLYPKNSVEKEIAQKLANGLGLPMKTVEEMNIEDMKSNNLILFGGKCINYASTLFYEIVPCEAAIQMGEGNGYIIFFKRDNHNIINLQGYDLKATEDLVDFLLNFEKIPSFKQYNDISLVELKPYASLIK